MPIAVKCACGKALRVKDEHAGKRGKCPACGQVFVIPSGGSPQAARDPSGGTAGDQLPQGAAPVPAVKSGVEASVKFFPLAWLLLFCKPTITVDGQPHRLGWGKHFFELPPGRHTLRVYFRYFWMSRCGDNSVEVNVLPGKTSRVSYYMPPWIFAKGIMKVA